jgi:radical SAM protein
MDGGSMGKDIATSQGAVGRVDFDLRPFTVIWEVTRACDLRCVHCRADAQPGRDPRELTTAEGGALLDEIRDLGSPVFVITGGDPLKRPDLFELIEHAVRIGLAVAVTPSGTPLLTGAVVRRFAERGVRRMAISLDGPDADSHDSFRRQPGSFARTVEALAHARACGLPVQINTTATRRNLMLLPALAERVGELGAVMWSVFFLVTVGRAGAADQLTAAEYESVFGLLYECSRRGPFAVRSTAAPQYRRFVAQRMVEAKRAGAATVVPPVAGIATDMARAPRGVTDGNGIAFVSHTGGVYPSGFLPLCAGDVRTTPLARIYREAPLFQRLRDLDQLGGKCGVCEFRHLCGGSRARAYAATGDPLAEEPLCSYIPRRARKD